MGCGSSRVESSRFRQTYGEPSEFDTCSSVVSAVRDTRGEPDGREVLSSPAPKDVLNDYNNRISNFPTRERLSSLPRRKSAPRSAVSKTRSNPIRTDSDFNELTEPADNDDGSLGGVDEAKGTQIAEPIGDSGDFLTAS
ncbi:uncharacterized protein LOC119723610 isoform X1 [Patiria miniata]|uniref:Uncharacterized protein n=1 Tax=Patiria miniata TaxID=46514 RepID=A0A913ZGU9_PATMI|nr:uncharacterized protein LOC119723610 isoform X1 [Patiria miniata]XP_038050277.1 uncharacterized protein LOC119723610 isoform X1 [Patiria miniata]